MKKRTRCLRFVTIFFTLFLLSVSSLTIFVVSGVPGQGTSITVENVATGATPSTDWSYTITELSPPKKKQPYTVSFTLPAEGGGTFSFGGLRNGLYLVAETSKFGYGAEYAVTSNRFDPGPDGPGFWVIIDLESSEGKTVTFTNYGMPAFAMPGLVLEPPEGLGYSIPPLKPVPVQASWDVDVNGDGRWDLVLGKPVVILVNLTGPTFQPGDMVTVSVAFEEVVHSRTVAADSLVGDAVVSFYSVDDEIVPSSAGDKEITGIYQVNGGTEVALETTLVSVKDTISLPLYYAKVTSKNYGKTVPGFDETVQKSRDFIEATYPVGSVTHSVGPDIAGSRSGSRRDPYAGMLEDCQAVAQQAQLAMGGSAIGIAIAPDGYFEYHGFPGAAGVSFGDDVKGVIALDGYWTVPAHEVAHTFGLYYGVPEEYQLLGAPFLASGVHFSTGEWRTGYSFMSVAEHLTTGLTWVNTDSTFEYLFSKTRIVPDDPEILLVNGVVYENDDGTKTVEFPLDWVHIQEGTEHTLIPGDYSLEFFNLLGEPTDPSISFGLSFTFQIDWPGTAMDGLEVYTGVGGFSFAVPYPSADTYEVRVVDSTGTTLATYYMSDVQSFSCSASLEGTEGLNDWYVSPVDVTISTTVDPNAIQPYYVSEIHYILDGTETIVYDTSAQFTITTDGSHILEYWAVDNFDNAAAHHIQTVDIDTTAPTTTDDYDGLWHNGVTITLSATDGAIGSGISETYYEINGGDTKSVSVDGQPLITTESATNSLVYWSIDVAGNVESPHNAVSDIKVDTTAPTITGAPDRDPNENGWYNDDVVVSFTADDALSGVASVTDPVTVGEGEGQSVVGTAVDLAGNSATFTVGGINIDKTAPTIIINSPLDGTSYALGQSVVADWIAEDSLSGIDYAIGTVASGELIDTSTVGTKTFTVTAFDKAGNTATKTVTYIVGYVFSGFQSPIPGSQYNLGRTVPVKFQLTDYQGNFVTTAVANMFIAQKDTAGEWVDIPITGDNEFRYSATDNQYMFNLDTTGLSAGDLRMTATLDDDTSHSVDIILR